MPTRPSSAYVLCKLTQAAIGSVTYAPELSAMVWKIKQLGGGKEYLMRAHFGLPSVRNGMYMGSTNLSEETLARRTPINVKFEIPYFTVSGIQVRYLKLVEKSGYQALPWVRYITQNGEYDLRTQSEKNASHLSHFAT